MKKKVYRNGATLIYFKQPLKSTSVCAGFIFGNNRDKHPEPTAHFLEHMFFKETEKYSFEELSKKMREVYSIYNYNATTSPYRVYIDFSRANKALEPCFELASEQLLRTKFSKKCINNEKGVIKEELVRRNNDFNRQFYYTLSRTLQTDCVYTNSNAILGSKEEIDAVTPEQLRLFRDENFTAKNFVICISGGISYLRAKHLAKKYFISKLRPTPDNYVVDRESHREISREGNLNIETFNFKKAIGNITVRLDDALCVDETNGKLSILRSALVDLSGKYTKLLREAGLVYSSNVYCDTSCKTYSISFKFECSPENVNPILDKISTLLKELRASKLEDELIKNIKRSKKLQEDENSIIAYSNASNIMQRFTTWQDKIFDKKREKRLEKAFNSVTSDDILQLCQNIFSKPENIYVTLLTSPDHPDYYSYQEIQTMLTTGKKPRKKSETSKTQSTDIKNQKQGK